MVSAAQDLSGNRWPLLFNGPLRPVIRPNIGQWSQVINWPLVAINVVLLDTGKILMWTVVAIVSALHLHRLGSDCGAHSRRSFECFDKRQRYLLLRMVSMSDGRILVFGGHDCTGIAAGTAYANIFDPRTQQWTAARAMTYPRYYPTGTVLGDGQVLVTSGAAASNTDFIRVPELYDPNTNSWTALSQAGIYVPSYPFIYQLPDGRILEAGSGEFDGAIGAITPSKVLDLKTQTWTTVDPNPVSGSSSVMYLPGKVMESGSAYDALTGLSMHPAQPLMSSI